MYSTFQILSHKHNPTKALCTWVGKSLFWGVIILCTVMYSVLIRLFEYTFTRQSSLSILIPSPTIACNTLFCLLPWTAAGSLDLYILIATIPSPHYKAATTAHFNTCTYTRVKILLDDFGKFVTD